jgi:hypothetical protein
MEEAKQFGATLFDALVHDDVREAYGESPAGSRAIFGTGAQDTHAWLSSTGIVIMF